MESLVWIGLCIVIVCAIGLRNWLHIDTLEAKMAALETNVARLLPPVPHAEDHEEAAS
jgi:hypothetical protein